MANGRIHLLLCALHGRPTTILIHVILVLPATAPPTTARSTRWVHILQRVLIHHLAAKGGCAGSCGEDVLECGDFVGSGPVGGGKDDVELDEEVAVFVRALVDGHALA